MAFINIFCLCFSLFLSTTTKNIERAFLQNDAKSLYLLFSSKDLFGVYLPEPISFSDQISPFQAYFFFLKLFFSFKTLEFFPAIEIPPLLYDEPFIFKARWSFRHSRTQNQYVYHLFFYLIPEKNKTQLKKSFLWKISEIKAEKL